MILLDLLRRDIRSRFVEGGDRGEYSLKNRLVDDRLKVPHEVRELLALRRVDVDSARTQDEARDIDVRKRDALAHEERAAREVAVDRAQATQLARHEGGVHLDGV